MGVYIPQFVPAPPRLHSHNLHSCCGCCPQRSLTSPVTKAYNNVKLHSLTTEGNQKMKVNGGRRRGAHDVFVFARHLTGSPRAAGSAGWGRTSPEFLPAPPRLHSHNLHCCCGCCPQRSLTSPVTKAYKNVKLNSSG